MNLSKRPEFPVMAKARETKNKWLQSNKSYQLVDSKELLEDLLK